MNTFLYILGSLLLFHGIYQLAKYRIVVSEIRANVVAGAVKKSEKIHKIFVLAPVLHEEKTIETFLAGLSLQTYPTNAYEINVITTQRELVKDSKPNTIDILDRIVSEQRFPNVHIRRTHYPDTAGFKADQLRLAFERIRKEHGDAAVSESFFLLLDTDSEVGSDTLSEFNAFIEDGVEIYQQPLLYFKNIGFLNSPLMQSFAFLQSFFSISYEIPMFTGRFFPWRIKYLVGSGLCIKGSFLLRTGGFPNIIEDVRIGRLSSFLERTVRIVPGFRIVETAKNFPIYIKQSSVWFFGCGLFISDYVRARGLRNTSGCTGRDLSLITYGFFKAFRWLNKGVLHLIGLIAAVSRGSAPLAFLFLMSLLINSSVPALLVASDFKDIWQKKGYGGAGFTTAARSVLFSPLLYMINFVGPYYGLLKLLKYYLWGHITLPKTER